MVEYSSFISDIKNIMMDREGYEPPVGRVKDRNKKLNALATETFFIDIHLRKKLLPRKSFVMIDLSISTVYFNTFIEYLSDEFIRVGGRLL